MPGVAAARPRISTNALSQTRRFPPPWSAEHAVVEAHSE